MLPQLDREVHDDRDRIDEIVKSWLACQGADKQHYISSPRQCGKGPSMPLNPDRPTRLDYTKREHGSAGAKRSGGGAGGWRRH